MTRAEIRFGFGKNWQSYIGTALDERRIAIAVDSVRQLLKVEDLQGKTFLDAGCGSGLFSLAACLLGAKRVTAFDYDPDSVQASLTLREKAGISADKWTIQRGSILDNSFLATLEPADVVYAWGVLHHTGDMWQAIRNASRLVKPGGKFCLAIYNRVDSRVGGSRWWRAIKKTYSRSPRPIQFVMELSYATYRLVRTLARFGNPFKEIAEYRKDRGMSYWHDLVDWLGGYPYEFASAGEVFEFVAELGGFRLITLKTTSWLGNNEFTFLREVNGKVNGNW